MTDPCAWASATMSMSPLLSKLAKALPSIAAADWKIAPPRNAPPPIAVAWATRPVASALPTTSIDPLLSSLVEAFPVPVRAVS